MSDKFYVSEIATLDPTTFPSHVRVITRANVQRYVNQFGQINESYDWVDENGKVIGSGISTNVEPAESGSRVPSNTIPAMKPGDATK